jgi:hypothetical protein
MGIEEGEEVQDKGIHNVFNKIIILFKIDRGIKVFHDKQKPKQYMTTKPYYRRFYKEFCTQKMKANKTMGGWEV